MDGGIVLPRRETSGASVVGSRVGEVGVDKDTISKEDVVGEWAP